MGQCVSSGKQSLPLAPGSLISVIQGPPGRSQALPPWRCCAGVAGTVRAQAGCGRPGLAPSHGGAGCRQHVGAHSNHIDVLCLTGHAWPGDQRLGNMSPSVI